jgi:AraC-like DNA-binding protein
MSLKAFGVSPEQFIPDQIFVYVANGVVSADDGNKRYVLKAGEYYIARKNHLVRYKLEPESGEPDVLFICLDEELLRQFKQKHDPAITRFNSTDTFVKIEHTGMIPEFINSLKPYYDRSANIDQAFIDIKHDELLLILLQNQPELAGLLFDFAQPGKIDLEEFMMRNYKFNVSLARFALMTGRSLSAFKRDFMAIFNEAPNRWLVQKRLEEAYFLVHEKHKKPTEIYLELGFESLSHFCYVFKKRFGMTASGLGGN